MEKRGNEWRKEEEEKGRRKKKLWGGSCVGDDRTVWAKVLYLVASLFGVATNTPGAVE